MRKATIDNVAVLFAAQNSIYHQLVTDCYDLHRDARTYSGNLPVVAHPPCQLWGAMAAVNHARWGGEHNRPGNDGGLFAFALQAIRRCGGVLEHPAKSRAFSAHNIAIPHGQGWQQVDDLWICEVWQSAYGHQANKATWLIYSGCNSPAELRWDRPKGSHQIGWPDQRGKARNKPTLGKTEANATPIAFAETLIGLAQNCGGAINAKSKG